MKQLNIFFFGSEEVSTHDFVWFYGGHSVILTISAIGFIAAQI